LSLGIISQFLLIVHVFCISYWVGSFLPLRHMCKINNYKNLFTIAHNFGVYAVVYISLLIITGLIFSYILLGGIQPLITSAYGNVLLIKISFVSIILLAGAINKFKIVPLIKINQINGKNQLKKSIEIELTLTFFVLFFTSILTTSLTTPLGV
jgi:putative copper resistance protein D